MQPGNAHRGRERPTAGRDDAGRDDAGPDGTRDAPPLTGLRVLDLSRVLAGPWATQTLADLGADVVKVERPGAGDDTRGWGPPFVGEGEARAAAYFHGTNRSKRSVAIDLGSGDGLERLRGLVRRADVLVENFRAGGLARMGLDRDALAALNPSLIVCSITGFGQDGPRRDEPGYDAMIQAMSGHMSVTGGTEGPQKIGVALMDVMSGLYAAVAIQAALLRRARTGRGEHIDIALLDVAVATLANQAMNYLAGGEAPGRLGTAHPNIVPYQAFGCVDGHVMIAVGNDAQFARLCGVLGLDGLPDDDAFRTNAARVGNREAVVSRIGDALAHRKLDPLLAALAEAGVPSGPINTIDRVFADPQVVARGMRLDMGGVPGVRTPIRFEGAGTAAPRPSPGLGADGDDVLADPAWGGGADPG